MLGASGPATAESGLGMSISLGESEHLTRKSLIDPKLSAAGWRIHQIRTVLS